VTLAAAFGVGLPRDVSVEGGRIDSVLHQASLATGVLFALLFGVMLYSVLARRRTASQEAGNSTVASWRTLFFALGVFGLIDGTLFVTGLRDINDVFWDFNAVDAKPNVVRIEINAHQWAWDARYAGPDGKFGTRDDVISLDEVFVPKGAPVLVELASPDVIHSFFVPNLRVKRDAVPGRITALTFTPSVTGIYEIACAQLCGVNHYKMRGELRVLAPADYAAWVARGSALATRAYDPEDSTAHWAWDWKARK
jgi:cytochrome c oxidase subunit II